MRTVPPRELSPNRVPLRAFEDLDALDVDDAWIDRFRQRGVVDIKPGRTGGTEQVLPGDAPDGDRASVRDPR